MRVKEDNIRVSDPVFGLKHEFWAFLPLLYWMSILDAVKNLLFCFQTFGGRRSIDVLDSENQPGSGSGSRALGLTEDVWHQKYENKGEAF